MARSRALTLGTLCAALLLLPTCDETPSTGDGSLRRDGGIGSTKCNGPQDKSVDTATAIDLQPGDDNKITDYICPAGDRDYYKVTIPAGHKLLRVKAQHTGQVSKVNLTYLVLDAQGQTVAKAPAIEGKSFDARHCLPEGTYYIQVQDDGNDASDGTNPYKLSFETAADPDTNEANDNAASAKPVSGNVTGYISCTEDADWFSVSVGNNQLLEVKLSNTAATPVDLKYVIYDASEQRVAEDAIADGTRGASDLGAIHALPGAGNYLIKVEDAGNDEGDPAVAYTLAVTTRAEQDANDQGTRNDSPKTATVLGSDSFTRTVTGQIASKADVDYFKIDGLGSVSATNPAVMEVTLTYGGNSEVDPSVAFIYADAKSPCTKDACCRVLDPSGGGCANMLDCANQTYNCIDKGDSFCADAECAPGAGSGCPVQRNCAGAAVCMPNQRCGAEQVVRFDDDGTNGGASVRTAHPLIHPGPWYIRVNDLKNDDYEYGKNYTLTVKVQMDPDGAKELNSAYFPVLVSTNLESTVKKRHASAATTSGLSISGFISYEGDQDWYKIGNPCGGSVPCTLTASYSAGSGCPTGTGDSGLEFVYQLRQSDGDVKDAFPANPAPGQSGSFGGSSNCFLIRNGSSYILSVSDKGHNNWSWSCGYTINITATPGCNAPCQVYNGTCYVP